jgi:hypothetical protein
MRFTQSLKLAATFSAVLAIAAPPASAATTIKIEGQTVAIAVDQNYDLGSGITAQTFGSKFVESGTGGDVSGVNWSGECYGSAEITASSYADTILCVNRVGDADSYVSRLNYNNDGWDWTIVAGSGKYDGATGSGHLTTGWGDAKFGDKLIMTDKGSITLK